MKVSQASTPFRTPSVLKTQAKPAVDSTPADQVELNSDSGSGIQTSRLLGLGAFTVGGAALGVAAGLNPGPLSTAASVLLIPGAAVGGAVLGGILTEKVRPGEASTIVGGAIVGGLAGAALGIGQSVAMGMGGHPALAVTLGLSGAAAGLLGFLKAGSSN